MNVNIIIDMQNDFIEGSLKNDYAKAIIPKICEFIKQRKNENFISTLDTHLDEKYFQTQEGKMLPIKHCINKSWGHELNSSIQNILYENHVNIKYACKTTFGMNPESWKNMFDNINCKDKIHFFLTGVCTDICVVSNAIILKSLFPENEITVYSDLCAGTTPENHQKALDVMQSCQIKVEKFFDNV